MQNNFASSLADAGFTGTVSVSSVEPSSIVNEVAVRVWGCGDAPPPLAPPPGAPPAAGGTYDYSYAALFGRRTQEVDLNYDLAFTGDRKELAQNELGYYHYDDDAENNKLSAEENRKVEEAIQEKI